MIALSKDVLNEYIAETREMCERVSLNLGLVEKSQHKQETLNSIYRDIHSVKGTSQLFGFQNVSSVSHAMESMLDPIRNQVFKINAAILDALYTGLDMINKLINSIATDGRENEEIIKNVGSIVAKLAALTVRSVGGDVSVVKEAITVPQTKKNLAALERPMPVAAPKTPTSSTLADSQRSTQPVAKETTTSHASKSLHAKDSVAKDDSTVEGSSVRIQVGLLDNLMNQVGELVLIRNQLLQIGSKSADDEFVKIGQRLNVVTSELQTNVMKTRMQPIGAILSKFHRVVRDLSRDLGKSIDFKVDGTETELDKTLIEAVKDPLTHLVRNCVDHGIEKPVDRIASGKSSSGTITVKAYHESGQVVIDVIDDGRGLDPQRIGKKAFEKGIVTQEQMTKLTDQELQFLIFAPGFSTAETVSNISGRGVGMDVVKTNIERIGGTVDLDSKPSVGTVVRLKIPITLAIVPALTIQCAGARFAIPQAKVSELVRVDNDNLSEDKRIEFLQNEPVYRLRGKLLPLVELSKTLRIQKDGSLSISERPAVNIVVLHSDQGEFGLIVDEIIDSSDIVVKPLTQALKSLTVYSGATIMGDGSVVLILDVSGLSSVSQISSSSIKENSIKADMASAKQRALDVAEYLLLNIGSDSKYAIPLCLVNRLEKFSTNQIKKAGDQRVVRYRDKLLPIISVRSFLGFNHDNHQTDHEEISVIVMTKANRDFGLEVKSIMDVVQITGDIDTSLADRVGIQGSLIHGSDVIVVLDALSIMDQTIGQLTHKSKAETVVKRTASKDAESINKRKRTRILFAEDTPFFRKIIKSTLQEYGFQVTDVANGEDAYKRLTDSPQNDFALILSDIEMPIMNGFELASKVRENPVWTKLPMIALTTRYRDKDIEMGKEAGFTSYLEKFDPERLVSHLDQILGI